VRGQCNFKDLLFWKLKTRLREADINIRVSCRDIKAWTSYDLSTSVHKLKCCPCPRYEGIYGSSTAVPLEPNLDSNDCSAPQSGRFIPEKEPGYSFNNGMSGPTADVRGEKSQLFQNSNPGASSPLAQPLYQLRHPCSCELVQRPSLFKFFVPL